MGRDMMRLRRGILLNTPHEEQASGAVASFTTDIGKLKECVVEFDPVQDLNGYDSPWPPGGGKNLLDPGTDGTIYGVTKRVNSDGTITFSGTATSTADFYFNGTTPSYTAYPLPNGTYHIEGSEGGSASTYDFFWIYQKDGEVKYANGRVHTPVTVDGEIPSRIFFRIYSGYTINLTAKLGFFNGTYQANAWSPYSNICPISGWSEAKVYDDPKYDRTVWWNQLFPYKNNAFSGNGFTVKGNNDGSFTITVTADTASESTAHNITSLSAGTMTLGHIYAWVGSKNGISIVIKNQSRYTDQIFTCTNAGYTNITFVFTDLPQGTYNIYPMLCDLTEMFGVGNEPSTVADFKALFPHDYYAYNAGEETLVSAVNGEPYRAVTIDLDGTRYGGTVDVVSGTMRVDRAKTMYTSELSISNWYSHDADYDTWGFYSNYDYRWQTVIGLLPVGDLIADKMPTVSSSYGTDRLNCSLILHQTGANAGTMQYMAFRIPKSLLPTPTDSANLTTLVKAWLDENPIEISFKIAPFTVQLTPAQLHAIKGQNNIFSDCGDVAVKYWKH